MFWVVQQAHLVAPQLLAPCKKAMPPYPCSQLLMGKSATGRVKGGPHPLPGSQEVRATETVCQHCSLLAC